jgi:protein ImuB
MLWFALYLPNLPLQVFQRGAPEAQPLAVADSVATTHPGSRRIVAANAAAQRRGVHAGLGAASALALAPDLVVRPRHARAEELALQEIAAWALRFTPGVSLDPPACVLLEASASLRLFGGAPALLQQLAEGCRALGFVAEAAGAPTPRAARWLARARHRALIEEADALPQALAPLPLDVLDAPAEVIEMLFCVGAVTLADCFQLPRAGLARRGATTLTQSLDQALGRLPDPRPWFVPPEHYTARIELAVPAAHAEPLFFAARRLFAGLAAYLAARHAGVERLSLHLEHEGSAATRLPITLGSTSRDEARFTLLAREHLARLELEQPAAALALEAGELRPLPGASPGLFGDEHHAAEERRLLIERLRARLGYEAVTGLRQVADHRPERAWQAAEPGAEAPPALPSPPRPLWLLAQPQRLEVRQAAPCWRGPLRLLAGPERIESGWWDDAEASHDYYIAATPDHELLWIFRELAPPHDWYVHGIFA